MILKVGVRTFVVYYNPQIFGCCMLSHFLYCEGFRHCEVNANLSKGMRVQLNLWGIILHSNGLWILLVILKSLYSARERTQNTQESGHLEI